MVAKRAKWVLGLLGIGAMGMAQAAQSAQAPPALASSASQGGVSFEVNQGQGPEWASYVVRARALQAALASDRVWIQLPGSAAGFAENLSVRLCGARADAPATSEAPQGVTTRLIGRDPSQWVRRAPTFGAVRFHDVWQGIDVVHRGEAGELRYDFEIAPCADPCAIEMQFEAEACLELDADGALLVQTPLGSVRHATPRIFQPALAADQVELAVEGSFELRGNGRVGFHVGAFDRARALVIDPTISLMLLVGGAGVEEASAVLSDGLGGWWLAGSTQGSVFPHSGATLGNTGSMSDAWVVHYDAQGQPLETLLIGGSGRDFASELAFDGLTLTIAGGTDSIDFPTTPGAFQVLLAGGLDAWVLKLDVAVMQPLYCTYLGGSADDELHALAIDLATEPVLVGRTQSSDFPRLGMLDVQLDGATDAFLTRISSDGSQILWSGYYGGATNDEARAVDLDASSAALIAGTRDMPAAEQAFVLRVDAGGDAEPAWIFDGSGADEARDIVADLGGVFHLLGQTDSADFPLLQPVQPVFGGSQDAFVLSYSDSQGLLASTYLGGPGAEFAMALHAGVQVPGIVDWRVLLQTESKSGLPLVSALCPWPGYDRDTYVAELDIETSSVNWATFLPGDDQEYGEEMAVDAAGQIAIVGRLRNRRDEHDQPADIQYGACGLLNNTSGFLTVLENSGQPGGGEAYFACTHDVATFDVAYTFFVHRKLGSLGAGDIQVGVYDETLPGGYVPNVSALVQFHDGEQVAQGSIVLPAALGPGPKTVYLSLRSASGVLSLGGTSVRELLVSQGSHGGGGGGGGGSSNPWDNCCAATSASDGMDAQRGLNGLRAFRDRVLLRLPGGKALTSWYYRASEIVVPWMRRYVLVHVLVSVLLLPLVAFAAHPGWWLLVFVLAVGWRRRSRLQRSNPAWVPRGLAAAVRAG